MGKTNDMGGVTMYEINRKGQSQALEDTANSIGKFMQQKVDELQEKLSVAEEQRDEALAKLAAMESQPPYRWLVGDRAWEGENIAKVRASAAASSFGERIEAIPVYAKPVPADKPAVAVPKKLPVIETGKDKETSPAHRYVKGWNDCIDAMLAVAPSHSQQSAEPNGLPSCDAEAGERMENYCRSFGEFAPRFPAPFRWQQLYNAALGLPVTDEFERCPNHESEQ